MNDIENFDQRLLRYINERMIHLLYKDELGDIFILTKYFEIFMKEDDNLGVYSWNTNAFKKVKQYALQEPVKALDIHCFEIHTDDLDNLIRLGVHKRRVHRNGTWLQDKEKRLGHIIMPYTPTIKTIKTYKE
jgi:hypothetical protein